MRKSIERKFEAPYKIHGFSRKAMQNALIDSRVVSWPKSLLQYVYRAVDRQPNLLTKDS